MKNFDVDTFIWGYAAGHCDGKNQKTRCNAGGHGLEWAAVAVVVGIAVLSALIFGG